VYKRQPWSIAIPHPTCDPVVLDISNATSGKGAIRHFAMTGRELPADWALDPAGRPVTDPGEAAGALLAPIGGYKGYGIALMIDLLTGGLGAGLALSLVRGRDAERRRTPASAAARPLAKTVMKGYVAAADRVKGWTAEARENLEDIYAEVQAEPELTATSLIPISSDSPST